MGVIILQTIAEEGGCSSTSPSSSNSLSVSSPYPERRVYVLGCRRFHLMEKKAAAPAGTTQAAATALEAAFEAMFDGPVYRKWIQRVVQNEDVWQSGSNASTSNLRLCSRSAGHIAEQPPSRADHACQRLFNSISTCTERMPLWLLICRSCCYGVGCPTFACIRSLPFSLPALPLSVHCHYHAASQWPYPFSNC